MTEEQKLKNEIEFLKAKISILEKYKEREKYKVYERRIKPYKRSNNNNSLEICVPVDIVRKYKLTKGQYLGFKQDWHCFYILFDNLENTITRKITSKGKNHLSINIPKKIKKNKALNNNTILTMYEFENKLVLKKN